MQSENAVHRVVNDVADARAIVEALLEDKIQEAGQLYMRVFGPDIPEKGYFFNGTNPIRDFIKQEVPDANFQNVRVQTYSNKFVNLGYTFVVSDGKAITIFSKIKPKFGNEGVKAMEQSLKLTNQTPVTWNGNTEPAGQLIYGQPVHAQQQQQQTAAARRAQAEVYTFGGLMPNGQLKNINVINHDAMAKGLRDGFAFVIRSTQDGTFSVVTPPNFRFSDTAIQNLEKTFNIGPKTEVNWFKGNITHGDPVEALYAIYGKNTPQPAPPSGLTTPSPKI
jgi:hypothetical protein